MKFVLLALLGTISANFLSLETEPTNPALCCTSCTGIKEKYYSIDTNKNMCGEACMNPSHFWIFKIFEKNLAKDENDSNTPCADRKYSVYDSTPTHGIPPITMTLDLYAPDDVVTEASEIEVTEE